MALALNRIVLYAENLEATVAFYEKYFGFKAHREDGDRIVELVSPAGGARLMLDQAGKGQRSG